MSNPRSPRNAARFALGATVNACCALALAAGLALTSAGCKHVGSQDRQVLSVYLENAAQYYDGGHYERAFHQWQKALDIDDGEDRARLGQAMALFQMGREETPQGVERLGTAEQRLGELRNGGIGDMSWKAEIGYALVQQRWAELYERKVRKAALASKASGAGSSDSSALPDPKSSSDTVTARAELTRRNGLAESSFRKVLADPRTEPNLQMSCWIGLARCAIVRSDWESALQWARKFEASVVESKEFWKKQGQDYASKLFGATLQEAELRDVLGNCLFKLGRFDEAEAELTKLIAIQPKRSEAFLNRGLIRNRRQAWDLARSDLREFLHSTTLPAGDPSSVEAAQALLVAEEALRAEEGR